MSEREPIHFRRSIWDGLIIGATMSLLIIAAIWVAVIFAGDPQRAIVCELALPVNDAGRSEATTNTRCLIPNKLDPIDSNGNGVIEVEHP